MTRYSFYYNNWTMSIGHHTASDTTQEHLLNTSSTPSPNNY